MALHDAERWALSTAVARRSHGPLTLFTDSEGARRLERAGIEFDTVRTDLDGFSGLDPCFWAAGKVFTYSIMDEPFLHIDDDVFLFGRLPDRVLQAGLAVQSPENDGKEFQYYQNAIGYFSPADVEELISPINDWVSYNAGLFGGHDLEFIHRCARRGLEWGRRMTAQGRAKEQGMTLMEQALFARMAREEGKHVECLLARRTDPLAKKIGYTHLVDSKWHTWVRAKVSQRLRKEDPEGYSRVQEAYGVAI